MENSNIDFWAITPQFWTIIWSLIALVGIFIFVKIYLSKRDPLKRPGGLQVVIEAVFQGLENMMVDVTGGKMKGAYPYFFTLFFFILVSANMDLIGFTAGSTAIAFTLTLGTITFIGSFIIGIATAGLFGFLWHHYKNPVEIIGQFGPLLSISLRLFGSTLATTIILEAVPVVLNEMLRPDGGYADGSQTALWYTWFPFIQVTYEWAYKGYTLFFGAIQAFIFTFLTMTYWSNAYNEHGMEKYAKKQAAKEEAAIKADKADKTKSSSKALIKK